MIQQEAILRLTTAPIASPLDIAAVLEDAGNRYLDLSDAISNQYLADRPPVGTPR
jgi:hypothetical protein